VVSCKFATTQDRNREVSISLTMPTDKSPVKLTIRLVKVLPSDQCDQLYGVTFRQYVHLNTHLIIIIQLNSNKIRTRSQLASPLQTSYCWFQRFVPSALVGQK